MAPVRAPPSGTSFTALPYPLLMVLSERHFPAPTLHAALLGWATHFAGPQLGLAASPGPIDGQLLELLLGVAAMLVRHPAPAAVRAERPRVGLVGEGQIEDLEAGGPATRGRAPAPPPRPGGPGCAPSGRPSRCRAAGAGRARPPGHWVRRRSGRSASAPRSCPRWNGPDVLRELGDARAQAAQATDGQVDLHAGPRGPVEGVDHVGVGQAVELERDAPGGTGVGLLLDHGQDARPHRHRRHQDLAVGGVAGEAGQVVEELARRRRRSRDRP